MFSKNKQNLRITSINVRGLCELKKRARLFKEWKEKYDIIFVSETHSSSLSEEAWSNEWKGQSENDSIWSNGSNKARGCAILTTGIKLKTIFKSENGRIVLASCDLPHYGTVCLISVYAPTKDKQKSQLEF